jgi:rRNA methylases
MPDIIPVADPADPRIQAYCAIRERDLVGREGLFIAEGKVVLAMLLASERYRPQSLLIAAHRIGALADLLADVPAGVPVFVAEQAVLDAIAGFAIHRGILAIGRRIDTPGPDSLLEALPAQATILLLSAIANHDNMGGIFRNAAAFGVDAVILDPTTTDPLYRRSTRVSLGHVLRVPFARVAAEAWPGQIDELRSDGFTTIALTPAEGSEPLGRLLESSPPKVALLLGAEGPGLTGAALAHVDRHIRIPMEPGVDSVNVATAAAIALSALYGLG